jgi:DNA-binding NarL/FixJ family response regulator
MQKIRIMVVDDHTIVRDGIQSLLSLTPDIEVVGEAVNGREALETARKLLPDVIIMDISMPIMDGMEATRRIHKELPEIKIIILTQYDDSEHVFPIIEAGACGFISKIAASSELISGIRSVHRGDSYLSPSVARLLIESHQQGGRSRRTYDPYEQLTDREREIFKLLAEGHTTQEIARLLVISPKTVEGHKTNLMAKLNLHNRVDLVKYALRKGIISA